MSEVASILPPSQDQDPLRRALDCLSEGFQVIGFDWTYVYLNPAAARHGRRTPRDLIGRPIAEAYPGIEQTPVFALMRSCMEQRTSHVMENQFTFPDGSAHWFEVRIQPVPEGICVYSADIDARKRRQLAAERHGGQLPSLLRWLRSLLTRRRTSGGDAT